MAIQRSTTFRRRRNYKRRTTTACPKRTTRVRNTISTLSKRIDRVASLAVRSNLYRRTFRQGTISTDGNQIVNIIGCCIPQNMKMLFGPNHNSSMSSLAFSIEKFYLHGISISFRVIAHEQPKPTNFCVALVTPTKNGNMRDTTGSLWTIGDDYYQDPTGKFHLNKTFWKVHKQKQFQVQHFERLNAAPATNSNQPPSYTQKYGNFYIKLKKPSRYVKGDRTDVWTLQETDLPYYQKYLFVVLQDNPDTAVGNTQQVGYYIKNYVEMPN